MRLTTRLLLPLLGTVAGVMLVFAFWALQQRERATTAEAQRVTGAYATALGLALEAGLRSGTPDDIQYAIDRISDEPTIYGVIVYTPESTVLFTSRPVGDIDSAPLAAVRRVLATGEPENFSREIDGGSVFSIMRPLFGSNYEVIGAMEVMQPWEFVRAEVGRTRQRFILNTLALLAAVTVVIMLLVRRQIAQPLNQFMEAVQALGRGELGYRTREDGSGAEIIALSREFNRMAAQLEQARAGLEREAEQRVALAGQLRETEKLAVVGNLAAGLGHEIAAPLHVIRGRAEMLRRKATDPSAQRNLHIITDQIDRITLIVKELLDFARRREPRMTDVALPEVLRGVTDFLEPELKRAGVTLVVEGDVVGLVHADPDLLHQVFINLLMNSIQVMAGQERERRIGIRIRDEAQAVLVDVEDTGPGFDDDVVHRIFDPFFTTKEPGQGTGLGLAVVRSIVEEHGGEVSAANRRAGGARFSIRLPAAVASHV
ncbi:MAG TPA: HAMP domain-containing sensor histidine kinase [Longimicrobiales bacterium]|nr:HAMP domain-containing sensor histidine kinase [Longimicrobiales bacterium]